MADRTSETSTGEDVEFKSKDEVVAAANTIAAGGLWSDDSLKLPMTWAGDTTQGAPSQETPRLGGMGRPDSAYALLLKKFSTDELSALTDVVVYELMTRQAIPGRNLKQGLASLIAPIESQIMSRIDSLRAETATVKSGKLDQQYEILEKKFEEIEKTMARRTQEEIVVMERATDVLAAYEQKKREEQAPGEELLRLQKERDELDSALRALKETQHRLPNLPAQSQGKRSARKIGLF